MSRIPGIRRFFRIDRGARDIERSVADELQFHFDMAMRDLMAQGMSPDEARREINRRFGDVDRTRTALTTIDRSRIDHERRAEWWSAAAQDLRYALRGLRLKPGFTIAVVLTLGLGIGANATMFGIVDRLLFRPPAMLASPERVHRIYLMRTFDGKTNAQGNIAFRRYQDLANWTSSLDGVATYNLMRVAVGTGEAARERRVGAASASIWSFFNAKPVIGRFFTADEDHVPAGTKVVVLSHAYWQSEYGGDRHVVGKTIHLGPSIYTIIGVAPRGFAGLGIETPVAFAPVTAIASDQFAGFLGRKQSYHNTYGFTWAEMYVRRKPGVSLEAATADLTTVYQRSYAAQAAESKGTTPAASTKPHVLVAPVQFERGPNQGQASKVALWLSGVAAVVLLIACANTANLLLARALRRRREIAVRVALGISRSRLFGQLLVESVLLAVFGAAAGLAIARWGSGIVRAALLPAVEWTTSIADRRLLFFAAVVTIIAGVLAGLAPAIQSGRGDVASALKSGGREGALHRSRLRTGLLVLQAALSMMLLVGAGLFVRSLRNVHAVRLGYDVNHVMFADLRLRGVTLDSAANISLRNQLVDRATQIPGVEHAARGVTVPYYMTWNDDLFVQGIDSVSRLGEFSLQAASPGFFETTGTRIVRGRGISPDDRAGSPPVVVVSQSMARVLWPGVEALGKCVRVSTPTSPCRTVVGIAEDIRTGKLDDAPSMHYYLPITQFATTGGGVFVRTRRDATTELAVVRRELQRLMPGAAYIAITPMSEVVEPIMRSWKLGATMFSVFGGVALLLAAIGLYSVIAYSVTQRTHELGVRVALGAQARDVIGLVVREGLRVTAVGVILGAAIAYYTSRWIAPLLFKVSPKDPAVFTSVVVTLLIVAVIASWWPALRASRVDPNTALRAE
jgi:predicted permease